MRTNKFFLIFLLTFFGLQDIYAQNDRLSTAEIDEYQEQAKQMVSFVEYMFNVLAGDDATTKQKQVVIDESYLKAFRDAEVQIEDDLDAERAVVTNKNVQAYLKDIDFFFKDAEFDFSVNDVSYYVTDQGQIFFKATVNRNLKGTTVNNEEVDANQLRFIEMNLDEDAKQLKIASIYTTKLNEREELASWWNEVPTYWKDILKEKIEVVIDTVSYRMLLEMVDIENLDLSNRREIRSVKPLERLYKLRTLDISHTSVSDIQPLRNLTRLEELNLSNTSVRDLMPLRYSTSLAMVNANNTQISDLSVFENFSKLKTLQCNSTLIFNLSPIENIREYEFANTAVTDITPLQKLGKLEHVNFSSTNITDLNPLSNLKQLKMLSMDYTPVTDLSPLSGLDSLQVISLNNTPVESLGPLSKISSLRKIYCDDTQINEAAAAEFMSQNPSAIVIYESQQLQSWWDGLDNFWKNILLSQTDVNVVTRESLAEIANISKLDISNRLEINSLKPLGRLRNLQWLNCSRTSITDLEPLVDLINLRYLDCSNTLISSLEPLSNADRLRELNINRTKVNSLEPLTSLYNMQRLSCEHTPLDEGKVLQFIREHPESIVIFKSDDLSLWWNEALSPAWKEIFKKQMGIPALPTQEQLHEMIFLKELSIVDNADIWDLTPLEKFVRLEELVIENTAVSDLTPITNLYTLKRLTCAQSPVSSLEPISQLIDLEALNCRNTPVDDLKPLRNLIDLSVLDVSGTQVSSLKHLSALINLRSLECHNTDVNKLNALKGLHNLEKLACYNTRVSQKEVNEFKGWHPSCNVIYY
ncbi:MAG: leucine-rich repeat domain-containing protein [Cyclobacteriaceae bacterium]